MDRAADDHAVDAALDSAADETGNAAAPQPAAAADPVRAEVASLSVAEQIRRQIREEGGAIKDPGLNLHLSMKGGGVEMTDEAAQFKAEHGKEFEPPPFVESEWHMPTLAVEEGSSGALTRWLIIGGLLLVLALAGIFYGLPAYREYSTRQAEAEKKQELGDHPPLEAVALDEAFYEGLDKAIKAANSANNAKQAYVYRYRVTEETVANASQKLLLTLVVGGAGAAKLVADHAAYDAAMQSWTTTVAAHPGVTIEAGYQNGMAGTEPLHGDRYVRYGEDFGREHMDELKPVIDRLESKRQTDGHYPRVLTAGEGQDAIRTNGGFGYIPRGFGYLPVYATDSRGNIVMGTGSSTIEQLTPREVKDYYLFYYLDNTLQGMDLYGPEAEDYYTRKIAPLPYDPGGPLHNVQLKPDGRPDGVACIVKSGKLLKDGEL